MKLDILFSGVLLALLMTLSSCHIGLKASADFVKTKEAGNSAIDEKERLDVNFGAFMEAAMPSYGMNKDADKSGPKKMQDDSYFSFRGELEYIGKGAKTSFDNSTSRIHLNYIEVPLTVCYNFPAGDGHIFGGLGPYFAYGIGGKIKGDGFSEKSFGENDGGYKRFDAGLTLMTGYKMSNPFSFSLSYDYGLVNTAYASEDISSKNRALSLNVYYTFSELFGSKKK
jgi:hypothetical protein